VAGNLEEADFHRSAPDLLGNLLLALLEVADVYDANFARRGFCALPAHAGFLVQFAKAVRVAGHGLHKNFSCDDFRHRRCQ
jgi:hypothetical protein